MNEIERVGTVDREATVSLLTDATSQGYLDTDEFGTRTAAAYSARTRQDLQTLTADLPRDWVRRRAAAQRRDRNRAAARLGMRIHLAAYLAGSVLMIGIWLAVGIAAGAWYPWPVWPILGWGLGLIGHVVPVKRAITPH